MTAYATRQVGDHIDCGTRIVRYGMAGDTYLTQRELGERADTLDESAARIGRRDWIVQIALRLRLAEHGVGYLDALRILAAADVTWNDICWMKS